MTEPIDINKPNVPTEPMMYWPRVRMTPLGPAPFCKMENPPNKTPTQTPTVDPIIRPILNLSKFSGWCWAYWYWGAGGILSLSSEGSTYAQGFERIKKNCIFAVAANRRRSPHILILLWVTLPAPLKQRSLRLKLQ